MNILLEIIIAAGWILFFIAQFLRYLKIRQKLKDARRKDQAYQFLMQQAEQGATEEEYARLKEMIKHVRDDSWTRQMVKDALAQEAQQKDG